MPIDINYLKQHQLILLEAISGSRAQGLNTPESDTDIRGVYIAPRAYFYGLNSTDQVHNSSQDLVYYEIGKFVDLLSKNNPNILELFYSQAPNILLRSPLMKLLEGKQILSKLCKQTFAGYARGQLKKADRLHRKVYQAMPRQRKGILDFCYVSYQGQSVQLHRWLEKMRFEARKCGLSRIPHMPGLYAIYYDSGDTLGFNGIIRDPENQDLVLSPIPKGFPCKAFLYCNFPAYEQHGKRHREYWSWIESRNEARYQKMRAEGGDYDAKHMMHVFRLLQMASEIAKEGQLRVLRPNREELLSIRNGKIPYTDLIQLAEEQLLQVEEAFEKSSLPEKPDVESLNQALIQIRESFYKK